MDAKYQIPDSLDKNNSVFTNKLKDNVIKILSHLPGIWHPASQISINS